MFKAVKIGLLTIFMMVAVPAMAQTSTSKGPERSAEVKAVFVKFNSALAELEEIANKGDPEAQFLVGSFYLNGIFVPVDHKKGVKFYEKSAAAGHPDGLYYTGIIYLNGSHGVTKDQTTGITHIKKAAEKQHKHAVIALQLLPN